MRNGVFVGVAGLLMLTGCSSPEPEPAPTVEVPVTQAVPDASYILDGTATVASEEYDDGFYGYVTVLARRGDSDSNRGPHLEGTLTLEGGNTITCSMRRSTVWSNFESFEELHLKCDGDIDPTKATAFTIQ